MESNAEATKAIREMNDSTIEGRNIVVNLAKQRD